MEYFSLAGRLQQQALLQTPRFQIPDFFEFFNFSRSNPMKKLAFTATLCIAALSAAYSTFGMAAETPTTGPAAVAARWTFDGGIHNNSLAVSADEHTAVVSYSERPDVIVYNLATGEVRAVLHAARN